MVEQAAVNRKVEGSSPSLGANFFKNAHRGREPERTESSGEAFCAKPCVARVKRIQLAQQA